MIPIKLSLTQRMEHSEIGTSWNDSSLAQNGLSVIDMNATKKGAKKSTNTLDTTTTDSFYSTHTYNEKNFFVSRSINYR